MQFPQPLIEGVLLRRYKRFLADVRLADGTSVTAHTPNTGSMKGCCDPGCRVWLEDTGNPKRKYPLSWEMIETACGTLVGVNTGRANQLVREAVSERRLAELTGYSSLRSEVRYGVEKSRIDLLLEGEAGGRCFIEVKNVTLAEDGVGCFPDAVTGRGSKHLRELILVREAGHRAVIFFCIQRGDVDQFRPADEIDPVYGQGLRAAIRCGVEALAYVADVSRHGISLARRVPVVCPG